MPITVPVLMLATLGFPDLVPSQRMYVVRSTRYSLTAQWWTVPASPFPALGYSSQCWLQTRHALASDKQVASGAGPEPSHPLEVLVLLSAAVIDCQNCVLQATCVTIAAIAVCNKLFVYKDKLLCLCACSLHPTKVSEHTTSQCNYGMMLSRQVVGVWFSARSR